MQSCARYSSSTGMRQHDTYWWSPESFAEEARAGATSSSLAFALDESVSRTCSVPQQVTSPLPLYDDVEAAPVGSSQIFQCDTSTDLELYRSGAPNWPSYDMHFAEVSYEEQYAASFGAPMLVTRSEGLVAPRDEIGYMGGLVVDTGVAGHEYGNGSFSPVSPHQYDAGFDIASPAEEPMVMPSPPTAAQISRSSALADAMRLPPALLARQVIPATSAPAPASTPSSPIAESVTGSVSPTNAAPPATSSKKRVKTGRPRGRPPKNPLTYVPRNQVRSAAQIEVTTGDPQTEPSKLSPDESAAAGVEHPGQSSFMLDTAVLEPPKKKPIMACLFCRERKIGCGPPPPEQEDQTCKQCKRRGLICEWPTESRRGQHKRIPREEQLIDEGDRFYIPAVPGPSSSKSKGKKKVSLKLSVEELEQRKTACDLEAISDRHTAVKRQRKLAAAQRKRVVDVQMSS